MYTGLNKTKTPKDENYSCLLLWKDMSLSGCQGGAAICDKRRLEHFLEHLFSKVKQV